MNKHEIAWCHANAQGKTWQEAGLWLSERDRGIAWSVVGGDRAGFVGFEADGTRSKFPDQGCDLSEAQYDAIDRACEALDLSKWPNAAARGNS